MVTVDGAWGALALERGVCGLGTPCELTAGLTRTCFRQLQAPGVINFCQKLSVTSVNYGEKLMPRKTPSLPKPWAPSDPGRAVQPAQPELEAGRAPEKGEICRE